MSLHFIAGAGPRHLAVEQVAADAIDARLATLASGATALYSCAGPP